MLPDKEKARKLPGFFVYAAFLKLFNFDVAEPNIVSMIL